MTLIRHSAAAFLLCLASCTAQHSEAPQDNLPTNVTNGMIAAANPHAVDAGLDILSQGGSAVDAAIAVQSVLGLVEPQSSGLGGGAFMLVHDPKTDDVWFYDGRETAPAGITPELFLDEDGKPIRYFEGIASGRSTGVPGVTVMLHRAYQDYGKLEWGTQLEPAKTLATNGFEISPRMANLMARAANYALGRQEAARAYFFQEDGKTTHPAGHLLKNPDYAETISALQKNPRALLEPPIANEIINAVQEEPRPGFLTLDDMAAYEPRKRKAHCTTYRDHKICGALPPSSGGVAVQSILGTLENFDMTALGQSLRGWHTFAEASFLAYADRDTYIADDEFVDVPIKEMLSSDYLAGRARLISPDAAMSEVKAGEFDVKWRGDDATPDSPGTSHFTIIDKNGLVVSMTTTVESVFGSQRMAAGFMLNNQLTDFSFRTHDDEGRPIANAPEPGKRPRSSMAPLIVFDADGEFLFTTGSPGGSAIIAYTAKTVVAMIDWGLSPQEAIELPNIIARNGSVRIEEELISEEILTGLESLGHNVIRSKGEISGIHIIYRQPDGTLIGGADPRREGVAKSL